MATTRLRILHEFFFSLCVGAILVMSGLWLVQRDYDKYDLLSRFDDLLYGLVWFVTRGAGRYHDPDAQIGQDIAFVLVLVLPGLFIFLVLRRFAHTAWSAWSLRYLPGIAAFCLPWIVWFGPPWEPRLVVLPLLLGGVVLCLIWAKWKGKHLSVCLGVFMPLVCFGVFSRYAWAWRHVLSADHMFGISLVSFVVWIVYVLPLREPLRQAPHRGLSKK